MASTTTPSSSPRADFAVDSCLFVGDMAFAPFGVHLSLLVLAATLALSIGFHSQMSIRKGPKAIVSNAWGKIRPCDEGIVYSANLHHKEAE